MELDFSIERRQVAIRILEASTDAGKGRRLWVGADFQARSTTPYKEAHGDLRSAIGRWPIPRDDSATQGQVRAGRGLEAVKDVLEDEDEDDENAGKWAVLLIEKAEGVGLSLMEKRERRLEGRACTGSSVHACARGASCRRGHPACRAKCYFFDGHEI